LTLKRRTTFVLGAGASNEFRLPLGSELKEQVRTRLTHFKHPEHISGDDPMVLALQDLQATRPEIIAASAKARAAIPMFASIDDFLLQFNGQPLIAEVCRLAIAEQIFQAEANSAIREILTPDPDLRGSAHGFAAGTWIGKLFRRLTFRAPSPEDAVANLSFVIFNYDRCLEAYLIAAMMDAFGVDQIKAAEVARLVPIEHVYGSMGPLPQLQPEGWSAPWGGGQVDLATAASKIRTYGEGIADDTAKDRIAELVSNAEQVVCLGYAFHRQGVELLFPGDPIPGQQGHTTAIGLGPRRAEIQKLFGDAGWFFDGPAAELLDRLDQLIQ
jgi:hypothetical protein